MKTNMHYGALPGIFARAQQLRKRMTRSEQIVWDYLRKNYREYHFRRQHPLDAYVVDFFSHHLKLIIEIDGLVHYGPDNIIKDQEREEKIKSLGLTIMRLDNDQVCCDFEKVKDKINRQILSSRGFQYPSVAELSHLVENGRSKH